MTKYKGIDSRVVKCASDSPSTIEGGISIDEDLLFFHFLEWQEVDEYAEYRQTTKAMKLDAENTKQLIALLKEVKFKKK